MLQNDVVAGVEHFPALRDGYLKSVAGVLRIGVVASNERALAFWRRLGYRETGEIKTAGPEFVREVIVLEKPIASA